jgi:glycosyltransferase involved in cell wall biosynthesis
MGERARRVAVERYSWKSVADRLLVVMRQASF